MSDVEAIKKAGQEFGDAFRANDVDGMASFYAADAVIMPPNEPEVRGTDAIRTWIQALVDRFSIQEFNVTPLEVVAAGDWGLRRATVSWRLAPKGGGEALHLSTKFLQIWQRQSDGSWKVLRGIWNSNDPLPES